MKPRRPALRYHGGKWRLAPWVLGFFPPHDIYLEPFGGGASVLLQKPRAYAEVYNDLDGEVVNVFQVLRDPDTARRLAEALALTPYSRVEFQAAYYAATEPVERARRTIVKSFMGFGSNSIHTATPRGMRTQVSSWHTYTGFRANAFKNGTTPAVDWSRYPAEIPALCARLAGVVIENRPAVEVVQQHDVPGCLTYADPPYVHSTRGPRVGYRNELSDDDHRTLAGVLHACRGMVVLSGYPSPLYDELYGAWERHERAHLADGARRRTEVLWLNPACARALKERLPLEAPAVTLPSTEPGTGPQEENDQA